MKSKILLVFALLVVLPACAFLQEKAGNRAAEFLGNAIGTYAECEDNRKVVKWAQDKCATIGLCGVQATGPISGALLKPLVDKFVPAGVDWAKPEAWGVCKLSRPKNGLKSALYAAIDALPVKFEVEE